MKEKRREPGLKHHQEGKAGGNRAANVRKNLAMWVDWVREEEGARGINLKREMTSTGNGRRGRRVITRGGPIGREGKTESGQKKFQSWKPSVSFIGRGGKGEMGAPGFQKTPFRKGLPKWRALI